MVTTAALLLALAHQAVIRGDLESGPGARTENEVTLFGHQVANIGDLDADGDDDIAIAAPLGWSSRGRTGTVLLVSSRAKTLLGRFDGELVDGEFGTIVNPIHAHPTKDRIALAITSRFMDAGVLVAQTQVIAVNGDPAPITLRGVGGLDRIGDVDGDGTDDYVGQCLESGTGQWSARWYSGHAFEALGRPAIAGPVQVLRADFDGDHLFDYLSAPIPEARSLLLVSSGRNLTITQLPVGDGSVEYSFSTAISIMGSGDGFPRVVIDNPVHGSGLSRLSVFSRGRAGFARELGRHPNIDERWCQNLLAPVADCDGDGCEDLVAASVPFGGETLRLLSGRTLEQLWESKGVVQSGTLAVATVSRVNTSDKVRVRELVVGSVLDGGSHGGQGEDGVVVFMSAKSGEIRQTLNEREFTQFVEPIAAPVKGK